MSLNIHRDDLLMAGEKIGFERGVVAGMSKGRSEGIAQGFSDGAYQTKLEMAKAFKRLGFDIAKIAEGTGLSVEEIKTL